jgi:hypothetical protein
MILHLHFNENWGKTFMGAMKKREERLNTLLQKCLCTYLRGDALFCILSLPKKTTSHRIS